MIYFLTSSPCVAGSPALNPVNDFVNELKKALPEPCSALFVCSDPDQPSLPYGFAEDMRDSFAQIGVSFTETAVLERENQDQCGELLANAGLIFLVGGHVPTQNAFFQEIGLREKLKGWDGVIVGVSAGSMNHRFYVLVDGSYILGRDGREELRGEAYLIEDGVLTQIGREGDIIQL